MASDGSMLRGSDPHKRRSDESSGQPSRLDEAPGSPTTSQFLPLLNNSPFLPVSPPQNAYEYHQHVGPNSDHSTRNTDLHHSPLNRRTTWHTSPTTLQDVQEADHQYNSFDPPRHQLTDHQSGFDGYPVEPNESSNAGARMTATQHIDNRHVEFTEAIEADYSTLAEGQLVQSHATVHGATLHRLPTSQPPTNGRIPIARNPQKNIDGDQTSQGTLERRFACDYPQCDVVCKRDGDLKRHKASKHGEGDVMQCDDCNFKSARKDKMTAHERLKPHSCQTFNSNQSGAT